MKASKYVARIRRERVHGWCGPVESVGGGTTREDALAALLADTAKQVEYDAVLPGDIVVPVEFAESIPDRMPDFYGLLILCVDTTNGSESRYYWAAVPLGKFRLLNAFDYDEGRIHVVGRHVASGKPVLHTVLDCNDDSTVLRLPDRSQSFHEGEWIPCQNIGAWVPLGMLVYGKDDEPTEVDAAT